MGARLLYRETPTRGARAPSETIFHLDDSEDYTEPYARANLRESARAAQASVRHDGDAVDLHHGLVVEERDRERRTETNWSFRTYDAAQVRRLLRSVPALEHVATFDFTYDTSAPRELDDEQLDLVLVLRKR